MENQTLTIEELMATGLSREEAELIVGTQEQSGGGLSFPIAKINYDPDFGKVGSIGFNPQKDEDGNVTGYERVFDNPIKMKILVQKYQYSYFNPTTNKAEVTSNLFELKDAKKAIDIKSGIPIADLKATNQDIKFTRVALVELYDANGNGYIAVMYFRGILNYTLSENLKSVRSPLIMTDLEVNLAKKKKGTVTYFEVDSIVATPLEKGEALTNLKKYTGALKEFNDWVDSVNGSVDTKPKVNNQKEEEEDDEDIVW